MFGEVTCGKSSSIVYKIESRVSSQKIFKLIYILIELHVKVIITTTDNMDFAFPFLPARLCLLEGLSLKMQE